MHSEQSILKTSIIVTIFISGLGVLFGLLADSFSIIFDGVYLLVDAALSGLALMVARLISLSTLPVPPSGKLRDRFTMGFWHLEPMVLGLNGLMLTGVSVYALINAISSLLSGGRDLEFSYAVFYAGFALIVCLIMGWMEIRANRKIQSDFIAIDAQSWFMSAGITAALFIAFLIGMLLEGTRWDWMLPYIDPAVLAIVCLVIIPMPFATIKQALADMLLFTPVELKENAETVAQEFVERYGFLSYRAYVAKVGRGTQIELYFIVPSDWPAQKLEEWDNIRHELADALGERSPDRWLTIAFTTDSEWAD